MLQFRTVELLHKEYVIDIAGRVIPIAALRTMLTGLAFVALILVAYFNGQQVQQQTLAWFAYTSGKGNCHVMPAGDSFLVTCGKPQTNTLTSSHV